MQRYCYLSKDWIEVKSLPTHRDSATLHSAVTDSTQNRSINLLSTSPLHIYPFEQKILYKKLNYISTPAFIAWVQPEPSIVSFSIILCHTQYYFEFKANEAHFPWIHYLLGRGAYVMVHMMWYTRIPTKLASAF